jgi:hypothetical protein
MTAIPTSFASAKPPAPRPWSRGRTILALLVLTFVGFSGWGIFRWWTYPTVPDVATVDLNTAINFMGSDDFNRMLEGHRLRYAMAVVDRLSQSSFGELSMMMMRWNERRAKIARNLRDIEGSDQLGSKLFAVFLDKFYAQSPAQQKAAAGPDQPAPRRVRAAEYDRVQAGHGAVPLAAAAQGAGDVRAVPHRFEEAAGCDGAQGPVLAAKDLTPRRWTFLSVMH